MAIVDHLNYNKLYDYIGPSMTIVGHVDDYSRLCGYTGHL